MPSVASRFEAPRSLIGPIRQLRAIRVVCRGPIVLFFRINWKIISSRANDDFLTIETVKNHELVCIKIHYRFIIFRVQRHSYASHQCQGHVNVNVDWDESINLDLIVHVNVNWMISIKVWMPPTTPISVERSRQCQCPLLNNSDNFHFLSHFLSSWLRLQVQVTLLIVFLILLMFVDHAKVASMSMPFNRWFWSFGRSRLYHCLNSWSCSCSFWWNFARFEKCR